VNFANDRHLQEALVFSKHNSSVAVDFTAWFRQMIGAFITSEGENLKNLKQRMKLRDYRSKVLLARIMRDRVEGRGVRG